MRDYQFHRLDERGAPVAVRLLALDSDAEAIRRALASNVPHGCDLWEGYRLLGRFYGPAPAPHAEAAIAA